MEDGHVPLVPLLLASPCSRLLSPFLVSSAVCFCVEEAESLLDGLHLGLKGLSKQLFIPLSVFKRVSFTFLIFSAIK